MSTYNITQMVLSRPKPTRTVRRPHGWQFFGMIATNAARRGRSDRVSRKMWSFALRWRPAARMWRYLSICRAWCVSVAAHSRFDALSSCIRPYLGWLSCSSDGDNHHETPLASAARRFAVSRRLHDWSELVDLLDASCTDSRPPGTTTELNIYSLESIRPIKTAENFEAVEWATGFSNKNGCI